MGVCGNAMFQPIFDSSLSTSFLFSFFFCAFSHPSIAPAKKAILCSHREKKEKKNEKQHRVSLEPFSLKRTVRHFNLGRKERGEGEKEKETRSRDGVSSCSNW